MRVWELALELQVESSVVLELVRAEGEWIASHLSTVPGPCLTTIRKAPPEKTRPPNDYRDYYGLPASSPGPWRTQRLATTKPKRRRRRSRRRPGPGPISFEMPSEEDEYGYRTDPLDDLKFEPEVSTRDAARMCGVSRAAIRQWVA